MTGKSAKPFLKWAGGKTQLINDIEKVLPQNIYIDKFTYIEPFVGYLGKIKELGIPLEVQFSQQVFLSIQ